MALLNILTPKYSKDYILSLIRRESQRFYTREVLSKKLNWFYPQNDLISSCCDNELCTLK